MFPVEGSVGEVCDKSEVQFYVKKLDLTQFEFLFPTEGIDSDSRFYKDLVKNKVEGVRCELNLPEGFPMKPPFIRVVHPRLTGGFVFGGGAVCFEPLTAQGWVSAMSLPSLAMALK